jgi:hypothetical protein
MRSRHWIPWLLALITRFAWRINFFSDREPGTLKKEQIKSLLLAFASVQRNGEEIPTQEMP